MRAIGTLWRDLPLFSGNFQNRQALNRHSKGFYIKKKPGLMIDVRFYDSMIKVRTVQVDQGFPKNKRANTVRPYILAI
jgi:hypothetical protein